MTYFVWWLILHWPLFGDAIAALTSRCAAPKARAQEAISRAKRDGKVVEELQEKVAALQRTVDEQQLELTRSAAERKALEAERDQCQKRELQTQEKAQKANEALLEAQKKNLAHSPAKEKARFKHPRTAIKGLRITPTVLTCRD